MNLQVFEKQEFGTVRVVERGAKGEMDRWKESKQQYASR